MGKASTAVATEDDRLAFYSGRRWHVLGAFGHSVCGHPRGLSSLKSAGQVPDRERCQGGCRTYWPKATDAS